MKHAPIDICCPSCGNRALFHEPFEFIGTKGDLAGRPYHEWGSWKVVELFPSTFKWVPPKTSSQYLRGGGNNGHGGYPLLHRGLYQCDHCHNNLKHILDWPNDAFWSWEIRGSQLWAWDMNHAQRILDYIKPVSRTRTYSYDLRCIPKEFLAAKVRELIVKRITRSLENKTEKPTADRL